MRQRGFGLIELVIVVACILAVAAVVYGIYHKGYAAGAAEKQVEWDADNAKKLAAAKARDALVDASLEAARKRAQDAEQEAEKNNRLLAEERRRAKRNGTALAACVTPDARASGGADDRVGGDGGGRGLQAPPAGGGGVAAGPRVAFTWPFVLQFDRAWTDLDGQPVQEAPAGGESPERSGASPYGAEDILDVHIANAEACSRDRRSLAAVMGRIDTAAKAWDRGSR